MAFFRYEAIDRAGKLVSGTMDAADEAAVAARLAQMGYRPQVIGAVPGRSASSSRTGAQSAYTPPPGASKLGGASAKDLALFFRQFASLVRSGISLYQAMQHLAPRTQQPALHQAAGEMGGAARTGGRVSDVMEKYPRLFAAHAVASVRAGELGGFLPDILDELALDYEQEIAFYKGSGMMKGMLLQGIAAVAIGQPVFPHIFPHQDYKTFFVLLHFRNLPIAAAIVGLLVWWYRRLQEPENRRKRDELQLRLPVFGDLARQHSLSAFVRTLRRLFHAGIAPITAWEGAMSVAPNMVIREKLVDAYGMIQRNVPLHDAFASTGLFANETEQLLATGMVSGQMVEMLDRVAEYYQDNVERAFASSRFWMMRLGCAGSIALSGLLLIWLMWAYFGSVFNFTKEFMPEAGM